VVLESFVPIALVRILARKKIENYRGR